MSIVHSLPEQLVPDALQLNFGGNGNQPIAGGDGVLAILSPDGRQLVYATYLGGRDDDLIRSMVFGPGGVIYLVGSTSSDDFPVTRGALQTTLGGKIDAFVVKLVPGKDG